MKRRNPPAQIEHASLRCGGTADGVAKDAAAIRDVTAHRLRGLQNLRTASGFTLIELLISMTVAAGLFLSIAMAVSSLVESYGAAYAERQMKDTVQNAFQLIGRDIAAAGRGMPPDLFGLGPVEVFDYESQIDWLYQNLIRDINSNAAPDELWLSGVGMDGSPTPERSTVVASFSGTTLRVVRRDGGDVGNAYVIPVTNGTDPESPVEFAGVNFGGVAPLYASIVHPLSAWRSPQPLPIIDLAPVNNALGETTHFDIQLDPTDVLTLAASPQPGDLVWFLRPVRNPDGTFARPAHMQQARWYWVEATGNAGVGTLYRQLAADPALPRSSQPTIDGVPILDNVVDFQVAFLVWRCGASEPEWVDHLFDGQNGTGEFAGAPYLAGSGPAAEADRLLALRARLMAIRVSLLVREARPQPGLFDELFGGSTATLVSEDRTLADLDDHYRHYLLQQVFDPTLLRLSTSAEDPTELFPRIRSAAADQRTVDPTSGACRGRKAQ